jgi:hypothetical protein
MEVWAAATLEFDHGGVLESAEPATDPETYSLPPLGELVERLSGALGAGRGQRQEADRVVAEAALNPVPYTPNQAGTAVSAAPAPAAERVDGNFKAIDTDDRVAAARANRPAVPMFFTRGFAAVRIKRRWGQQRGS